MLADWLASINLNVAEVLSLLCIAASCTQLLPTISRVLRRRSVGSLPFWPHLVEAGWRAWFCMYLWVVVRERRPLGRAPAEGWLAGHDDIDLFLYGDTILSCCIVWGMLGLFIAFGEMALHPSMSLLLYWTFLRCCLWLLGVDQDIRRAALALILSLGLPLSTFSFSNIVSQATLECGMLVKDFVIIFTRVIDVATRIRSRGSPVAVVTGTERWRHLMGATSAALRIVTTLGLGGSAVGSDTLLRGWLVILCAFAHECSLQILVVNAAFQRTCGGCANGTVSEVGMLGVFYTRQAGLDVKNQSILWMQQQQGDPYTVGSSDRDSSPRSRARSSSGRGAVLLPRSLSRSLSSGGALEKEL